MYSFETAARILTTGRRRGNAGRGYAPEVAGSGAMAAGHVPRRSGSSSSVTQGMSTISPESDILDVVDVAGRDVNDLEPAAGDPEHVCRVRLEPAQRTTAFPSTTRTFSVSAKRLHHVSTPPALLPRLRESDVAVSHGVSRSAALGRCLRRGGTRAVHRHTTFNEQVERDYCHGPDYKH